MTKVYRYKMTFGYWITILMSCFLIQNQLLAQSTDSQVIHSVFLIGDAGEPEIKQSQIGNVLRKQILAAGANSTVLYLGDNIYPGGLPDAGSGSYSTAEQVLQTQVDWINGLNTKGIFIPGNHDWDHWGRHGQEYIVRQQQWIDSLDFKNITFLPKQGCPGPVEIAIDNQLVLIILDTQWLLHQYDKPGEDGPCECKTTADVLTLLSDVFRRNQNKRIVVAGHHPLITYGNHGGVFSLKDHLFPLTDANRNLYIPMPVIGSLYPLYRKFFGHIQDTAHPVYKEFSTAIQDLLREYPGSIYVAGHEHALEYILKDSTHYVVSGAAVKVSDVKKKRHAIFAEDVTGFAQMSFYDNGKASLKFFQVDSAFPEGKEIYSTQFTAPSHLKSTVEKQVLDFSGKAVRVMASEQYRAGSGRKKMLGENYRKEWEQELEVPVFDIGTEKGGLKILQKGGGQQTLSLRMEDSTGHEFVIRSVEKYPEKAVPEMFRKTFAQDLVQDQISASHPYAALVIPSLAKAAGIYHTNPKLMYVPNDPRLKEYQKTFANTLVLFEERPAGDWSEASNFGNSKKIVNTSKVLEKLADDNDNLVDQRFVLKSRLFDLVIGDWDRHDDQWRWATLGGKKGDMFRPIPRDRDQAFFVNEGIVSKLWSRKWALPKFEGFDETIDWPSGLSFNARYFDRTFLTELAEEEWLESAKELKRALTDEVIERSIRQWPEEIFKLHGEKIIANLKKRRDNLEHDALSHYKFLSREVDVVGSDKRERFSVKRLPGGHTELKVFKITKENEKGKKIYERIFKKDETKEIRLYGLKGDDEFRITGESRKAILVRVIGCEGNDLLSDSSKIRSPGKSIFYYDNWNEPSTIVRSAEIKNKTSRDPNVNVYNRKSFEYDRLAPLIIGNYNPDDGIFIGGGFISLTQGFRKQPFKQRHLFLASIAPLTWSFNFRYQGKFTEVIGKWSLELKADLKAPNYVNNFFGFGNESIYNKKIEDDPTLSVDESINYYRYRFEEFRFETSLSRNIGSWGILKIGPSVQRIEMEEPEVNKDRFIETYASALDYDLFKEVNTYAGASWEFNIDKRNDQRLTNRGMHFITTGRAAGALDNNSGSFTSHESAISIYHSFRSASRVVFALRAGAGINTGTYEFYQAQVLDGRTELRGFRKTRFYGDKKFYSNFEVRIRLLNIRSYLFPASFGILGFHDVGRIWYKDVNGQDPSSATGRSSTWHRGWGGGVWFTPFNLTVLSTEVGHSKEGTLGYVRLGFLF